MTRKFEGVHAGNTSPETALDDAVRRGLEAAKDVKVSPIIEKNTDEVAIASTKVILDCPLERGVEETLKLLKK